jgi:PDZ domain-containing protein
MRSTPRALAALVVAFSLGQPRPLLAAGESPCAVSSHPDSKSPVEIPIRVANNHVYLQMCVGGAERWFWLDSGAARSILEIALADSLHLSKVGEARSTGMGAGSTQGAKIQGGEIFLAERPALHVTASTALPIPPGGLQGEPVAGIVGGDFIQLGVIEIDYANQRMRIHDPGSFRYAGPGTRLPLKLEGGRPHVKGALVLADGGVISTDFSIDLGATRSLALTKPFVEANHLLSRVGPTLYRPAGQGMGGVAWGHLGRVAALRLGDIELSSVITALFGDSAGVFTTGSQFQANIGGEILRRFVVILDYAHKEMILERNGVTDPFETDMSGAWYQPDGATGDLRVRDPLSGGPAAQAGLMDGDIILAIDGRPTREMDADARRRAMERDGATVVLKVRRNGAELDLRLLLRRLI